MTSNGQLGGLASRRHMLEHVQPNMLDIRLHACLPGMAAAAAGDLLLAGM